MMEKRKLKTSNILKKREMHSSMNVMEPTNKGILEHAPMMLGKLMLATTKTHFAHLKTQSYAAHMALDEFYDEIVDLVDLLIEQFQGAFEVLLDFQAMTIEPIKTDQDAIEYLRELYNHVDTMHKMCYHSEIQNNLDEIKTLINKTKYKLLFLK